VVRSLTGTVLVTGATGGIGAAVARELAGRGARLVLSGRDEARLADLAAELAAKAVPADLGAPEHVAGLVDAAGPVDTLVHCAGIGARGRLDATDVDRVVAVNLRAPLALTAALLPAMRERGYGHLAYVGSIAGLAAVREEAAYAATKAGLLMFAASLRAELVGTGVTVSTLSPAAVDTGFWAARGAPYHRRSPRLVPARRVARRVVADLGRDADRVDPRWLRVVPVLRAVSPRGYAALARRMDPPQA
jgi:short-subunit dehydrogenase